MRAGAALAQAVDAAGVVVSLEGPLGAGKTVFVKGLARGFGIDPAGVASPTFAIAHEYPTAGGTFLRHVDFYRVEDSRELEEVGFDDFLEPGALLAIEWGDRFPDALPKDRLEVRMARPGGSTGTRVALVAARGAASERVLARWQEALSRDEGIATESEVRWP